MNPQAEDPNPPQNLEAENTALRRRIAEFEEAKRQHAADEERIAEKMKRGCTREQAIVVIQRQREFDAAKASAKADRLRKLDSLLTGRESRADLIARARPAFPQFWGTTAIMAEIEEWLAKRRALNSDRTQDPSQKT
jgi:hypothetical protein